MSGEAGFRPTTLPTVPDFSCETQPERTVCDWANSVDAVIVGNVESRSYLDSPVWVRDSNPRLLDSCTAGGWIDAGAVFEISVTSVLYGNAPSKLDLVVPGYTMRREWVSQPREDDAGNFQWSDGADGPMEQGTTVGLPLIDVNGTWLLAGEFPFTFKADGSSVFVEAYCHGSLRQIFQPSSQVTSPEVGKPSFPSVRRLKNALHATKVNALAQPFRRTG